MLKENNANIKFNIQDSLKNKSERVMFMKIRKERPPPKINSMKVQKKKKKTVRVNFFINLGV